MLPLNNSVSQLATLSHSNHTLSPYARGHEHIAVRSFPYLSKPTATRTGNSGESESQPGSATAEGGGRIKARRKRLYRLGPKEPPLPTQLDRPVLLDPFDDSPPHRLSLGSASGSDDPPKPWHPNNLTSVAHRVMQGYGGRPSYGRAPDSRISYGFPPTLGIDSIAE